MQFERVAIVLVISILCTQISRFVARRFKIVDAPAALKIHEQDIPRFGGLGIFSALCVGILLLPPQHRSVLLGATVMWLVGVIDDRWTISSFQKLGGQLLAGCILCYLIFTSSPGTLGLVYGGLGFLLVVVFANAVNLIDGMNGLAGGNAFLIFIGFGVLLTIHGGDASLSLVTAAAILGFLPFNFPTARLFMGDSGSLLLGYLIAWVLIHLLIENPLFFICGLIISLVPLFDLALGVLRRLVGKKPVFAADRGHFYDRLNTVTNNTVITVLITYACTLVCIFIAVALSFTGLMVAASSFALLVVVLFAVSKTLGWLQTATQSERARQW